ATALGFASLALTPSKWTHHFGSLAGVGAVFLAGMLLLGVPLAAAAFGRRVPARAVFVVAASAALAAALAWRGPNSWPYAWREGLRRASPPPAPGAPALDRPPPWPPALAVGAPVVVRRAGRVEGLLRATPAVLALSLAASTVPLLGTFTAAAAAG